MYIHYMYPLVVIYVKEVFVYCILIINIYLFTFITDKLKPQLHTHIHTHIYQAFVLSSALRGLTGHGDSWAAPLS